MKKLLIGIFSLAGAFSFAQCEINTSASALTITCGESVDLTAFGTSTGEVVLDEDFNGSSFGSGWSGSPGATSFSNPCSGGGVDGTPHAWMDNNTTVPRTLTSQTYDLTAATAGVSICFDLLFAEQGDAAPCEGPDEPDEGVYLQYSTDGGATWIDIHYFDPNGGNDPALTNWGNWCFEIPAGAITGSTMFRWHQTADSGADYDHWGIDNVQIFQNDINAEVTWLHDGYSYGVGSPGGVNPNSVTPTSTTTYTAQIETGTGDICTSDITIIVEDPIYDVDLTVSPSTICSGDCASISGDVKVIVSPGGSKTYENNQTEALGGGGLNSGQVNVNVQNLNSTTVSNGMIEEVCINGIDYFGVGFSGFPPSLIEETVGDLSLILECPSGQQITLVSSGVTVGSGSGFGGGYQDVCFVPAGPLISTGSAPYSGSWQTEDSFDGLSGCDANGVWSIIIDPASFFGFGAGSFEGWSITFDDEEITTPACFDWSPTTGMTNPTDVNTDVCPLSTTDYLLEVSNCVPGCAVYQETVTITVDPCGGCVPPAFTVTQPAMLCVPFSYDLANAVSGTGANIVTYHNSDADANAGINPLGSSTISTALSYYVRVEDPSDPTCYSVQEIVVNGAPLDDPSFSVTDFCPGTTNQATGIATTGGTFSFDPVPSDGAIIDPATGEITNGTQGATYTVLYETNGMCPSQTTENVTITNTDDASFTLTDFCASSANSATAIATPGGTFSFNPAVSDGATIDATTGEITNGVTGTTYTVEYVTGGACSGTSTETVSVTSSDDASFTLTDFCSTSPNSATVIATPGGTFSFNPAVADGATIDATTGEITNGVPGTTYTVEYTTGGACSASSTEDVLVTLQDDASFTLTDFCEGDANSAAGIVTLGGTFSFNPAVADGATIDGATGEITNGIGGTTYTVEYTTVGACSASTTEDVTVSVVEDPSFTLTDFCEGDVNAATITGSTGGSFAFNPAVADGATIDGATGEITNGVGGTTYTVEYSFGGACPQSSTQDVTVNTIDDASFTLTDFCEGDANSATITGTPGGTFTFNPAVADGATIDASTGEITNGVGGTTYTVEYTTTGTCSASATQDVTVNAIDDASFTFFNFCVGTSNGPTNIVTTGGTFSFNPAVADGATINGTTGEISNGIVGTTYSVEYTTTGVCPSNSIETVTVTLEDDASFTLTDYCVGDANTATNIATPGGTFSFNPAVADGATIDGTTGEITNGVAGTTYTVEHTTTGACAASSTETVTVNTVDDPTFALTDYCEGDANSATGIATPGGTFAFNPAVTDGATINASTGEITNGVGGTAYTVEYTTSGTCPQSSTETVTVNGLPAPTITGGLQYCLGTTADLSADQVYAGYNWSNGGMNQNESFTDADNPITITVTDANGCTGTSPAVDVVEDEIVTDLVLTICDGEQIDIHGNMETVAGIYSNTFTTAQGCDSTANVQLIVDALPTVNAGTDIILCEDLSNTITLSASGASTYAWNNGVTNGVAFTQPSGTVTYTVTGTDANGCQNTDDVDVTVLGQMGLNLDVVDANCDLDNGSILAEALGGSGDYSYDWSNGQTGTLNINLGGGSYSVLVTDNITGCTVSGSAVVSSSSAPVSDFILLPDVMTLPDNSTSTFNNSSNANGYTWTITGDDYSFVSDVDELDVDLPEEAGSYEICLIAYNGPTCADTSCKIIEVRQNEILWVPNSFTPDGDEFNNTFKPIVLLSDDFGYEFQIFNRWGELIFESSDTKIGWDGTYNGVLVQNGTYVWKIRIKSLYTDEYKDFNGHVNMIR